MSILQSLSEHTQQAIPVDTRQQQGQVSLVRPPFSYSPELALASSVATLPKIRSLRLGLNSYSRRACKDAHPSLMGLDQPSGASMA